ncbi:transposase [Nocardia sp. NPDC059236]|uniref:transposase n=1 Tax=Nocardia sp. NPDC059236 TaxID=3346783 RepID=UPI0036775413
MARKPDVFVRAVTSEEGRKLAEIARRSRQPVQIRRAAMVMASVQHQPAGFIELMQVSESCVRQVIRDFNVRSPGAAPRDLGWPFSTWSLSKLRYVLHVNAIADSSRETLRLILEAGGVSWQATKTWKANDLNFSEKMAHVLDRCDNPPADGRVVCVDLQPRPGRGWSSRRRPERLRATTAPGGAAHVRPGPAHRAVVLPHPGPEAVDGIPRLLETLRARWPGEKLCLICDNYSVHKRREVRIWCADNAVESVFLPTNSSWLHRIECEFAALRYFALNDTDHRSHGEQEDAIGDYTRWRNQHAEPRSATSHSAPRSGHPDYLPNACRSAFPGSLSF